MRAATTPRSLFRTRRGISIPAAYAGCDDVQEFGSSIIPISIPAAYAGCDIAELEQAVADLISIPAAYAGCD